MARLRNTEALQHMLNGTHRTQTKKTFYYGDIKDKQHVAGKKTGECWIENEGTETESYWIMRNGKATEISGINYLRLTEPELFTVEKNNNECPQCKNVAEGHANSRMIKSQGMCLDCVAKRDTKLLYSGGYQEFQISKLQSNAAAWLRDTDLEFESMIADMEKNPQYYNSDGTIEKWDKPEDLGETIAQLREDYKEFRQRIIDYYALSAELIN